MSEKENRTSILASIVSSAASLFIAGGMLLAGSPAQAHKKPGTVTPKYGIHVPVKKPVKPGQVTPKYGVKPGPVVTPKYGMTPTPMPVVKYGFKPPQPVHPTVKYGIFAPPKH